MRTHDQTVKNAMQDDAKIADIRHRRRYRKRGYGGYGRRREYGRYAVMTTRACPSARRTRVTSATIVRFVFAYDDLPHDVLAMSAN